MYRVNSLFFVCVGFLLIHTSAAFGQFILVHAPIKSPIGGQLREIRISRPTGNETVPLQPVTFDSQVTVIVNQASLSGPQKSVLNTSLAAFFPKTGTIPLELISLQVPDQPLVVTATNRQQLTKGLTTLSVAALPDAAPISFGVLIDYLRTLPVSSTTWKQVVLVGPEPDVEAPLREYAYAVLLRTLSERRIRLSHFHLDEDSDPAWAQALRGAGGAVFGEDPVSNIDQSSSEWLEAKVPAWAPPAGFRVMPLALGASDKDARLIPWIWSETRRAWPTLTEYEEFQTRRGRVSQALAGNAPIPPETAGDVNLLLGFNPYDLESLRLATDLADRRRDYAAAAGHASRVVELEPDNGSYFSRLGFYHWQTGDADSAERDLLRARELKADHPQSAAILGDIRFTKKDYPSAAGHYQEAVRREPERVELWLKLADTQQVQGHKSDVALALEEVLKRKPEMWERRTQLIDYYVEAGEGNQALRHVQSGIALLPADAPLVTRFAGYAERLELPREAVRLWSRVIELDHTYEPAYYSLGRLQAQAGAWDQALSAAEAGVVAVSSSPRLHAQRVDALTALGRIDDARRVSRAAADHVPDPLLLNRTAIFEDRYGGDSSRYYRSLVEAIRSGSQPEAAWRPLAERGLRVSIREGQTDACGWFAALLASNLCGPAAFAADAPTIAVPGGFRALLFMAHGPQKSSDEAFLADYSRTLTANQVGLDQKGIEAYRESLVEYFRLLSDLKGMGKPSGGKTLVRLSLEDKKSQRITERVLGLIGWRSRREAGKLVVEAATKGRRARRQDLASALAIDVIAMQEHLQSGKEFVLEIPDERVAILPEERVWQSQFYAGEHYNGGFLEAIVRNPAMASLYTALSNMDPSSAALMVQSVGMKPLAEKYGKLLILYSSCLQISAGRVEVPGGTPAVPIWTALAKAPPSDPRRFLRTLLDKDDGHLLRFYFLLSQLDFTRQRFFTANQRRTEAFYEVFRQSNQVGGKAFRNITYASIEDLFRELPLDEAGRMEFPGGPEVWLVAKNKSSSVESTERRLNKLSRVTTPEVEDEILLRLIKSEYNQAASRLGAWQNFLAVVRVDASRTEPLDAAAALLLAEKYSANQGLYGYFAGLSRLDATHYREIFAFADKMPGLDRRKSNIASGLFQSVLYILSTAEETGRITPAKTSALLMDFAKAMNQAPLPAQWTRASLDFVGAYLDTAGADRNSPSLRDILLPAVANQTIPITEGHTVNPGEDLRNSYSRILELQKVPPLDELLRVHAALKVFISEKGDTRAAVKTLTETTQKFQDVEVPSKMKLPNTDMELLKSSQLSQFAGLNRQLQKEVARKKIDPKNLRKLAEDYWDSLAFRTTVALAGQIYAASFHSDDSLVAEDPLFLRKHQYVAGEGSSREYFASADLSVSSEGAGSRVVGGFDGICRVAGQVAARGLRNADPTSSFVSYALLGSIRATDWSHINQASLRGVAVRIHAAQDWLVLSSTQPRLYEAVSIASYGLLSLNRRSRLLLALNRRDWDTVWSSLSLTDLFFLAGRLREQKARDGERSPAIDEYSASPVGMPNGVSVLGPALLYLRRHPSPGMVELAPYEDSAAEVLPIYLAERVAEFKVYLVRLFAEQELPAAALPSVAEAAARAVLGDMLMTNYKDWPAVLDAYEEFDGARLQEIIGAL